MRQILFILFVLLTASIINCQAATFATLYSFKGTTDGSGPNGVTIDSHGVVYGTTFGGGTGGVGTVFALTPVKEAEWNKTVLFNFGGASGAGPSSAGAGNPAPGASLVLGPHGSLFGTTEAGGSGNNGGTVFELSPPSVSGNQWVETVLYSFPGGPNAPHLPFGGLTRTANGALYGTTWSDIFPNGHQYGSPAGGTVYVIYPPGATGGSWKESTLLDLKDSTVPGLQDLPNAGVTFLGGSLFGTTSFDALSCGAVYELSPPDVEGGSWTPTLTHEFAGPPTDACGSFASLTPGPGGVLYGTSYDGGDATPCYYEPFLVSGCGTVFQLMPPDVPGGAWTETVIYNFTGVNGDGVYPTAGVVVGKGGVLYGTTTRGGPSEPSCAPYYGATGCGTVFQLTPPANQGEPWTETILHTFTGQNGDGSNPGPLTLSSTGVLYGPTFGGGFAGQGTIFALVP